MYTQALTYLNFSRLQNKSKQIAVAKIIYSLTFYRSSLFATEPAVSLHSKAGEVRKGEETR